MHTRECGGVHLDCILYLGVLAPRQADTLFSGLKWKEIATKKS